ncbi:UNVERIFIED_CONTAM: hypothetical protein Sangu_0995100 [Sesamum angustifolium]|uniref:Uncharacterized protein n=1 Tax=Sesamum angustifolium TaxID=2727405 RepID=A0AAW2PFZ3_9LAMI
MSERPVPRRESPWGVSEGEHRQPKAHRCNDRAEDLIHQYVNEGRIWLEKNADSLRNGRLQS